MCNATGVLSVTTVLPPDLQKLSEVLPPVVRTAKARELVGGVSRSRLYELCAAGEVEAVRAPGASKTAATLWKTASLLRYIARMQSIRVKPRRRKAASTVEAQP
jgi:hypothetical protein